MSGGNPRAAGGLSTRYHGGHLRDRDPRRHGRLGGFYVVHWGRYETKGSSSADEGSSRAQVGPLGGEGSQARSGRAVVRLVDFQALPWM